MIRVMNEAVLALQPLCTAASEYEARQVGRDTALLGTLGLYVRLQKGQVRATGEAALFIAEFETSTEQAGSGMVVTCVGFAADPQSAANEATAHWCLGVLPVLAHWRGGHTCFAGTRALSLPGSSGDVPYEVIQGPVVERGEHDGGTPDEPPNDVFLSLLTEPLRASKLPRRKHWLECYAVRQGGGVVDATCRLDNRDWMPGQQLLAAEAARWPGRTTTMHSRRQFLLLLPQGSEPEEPEPPQRRSFWGRLFGRS